MARRIRAGGPSPRRDPAFARDRTRSSAAAGSTAPRVEQRGRRGTTCFNCPCFTAVLARWPSSLGRLRAVARCRASADGADLSSRAPPAGQRRRRCRGGAMRAEHRSVALRGWEVVWMLSRRPRCRRRIIYLYDRPAARGPPASCPGPPWARPVDKACTRSTAGSNLLRFGATRAFLASFHSRTPASEPSLSDRGPSARSHAALSPPWRGGKSWPWRRSPPIAHDCPSACLCRRATAARWRAHAGRLGQLSRPAAVGDDGPTAAASLLTWQAAPITAAAPPGSAPEPAPPQSRTL
jgi:hypothetical protein